MLIVLLFIQRYAIKSATYFATLKQKNPSITGALELFGGLDGTRTRDPLRDRQVF